jgi:hypothetical protein
MDGMENQASGLRLSGADDTRMPSALYRYKIGR